MLQLFFDQGEVLLFQKLAQAFNRIQVCHTLLKMFRKVILLHDTCHSHIFVNLVFNKGWWPNNLVFPLVRIKFSASLAKNKGYLSLFVTLVSQSFEPLFFYCFLVGILTSKTNLLARTQKVNVRKIHKTEGKALF